MASFNRKDMRKGGDDSDYDSDENRDSFDDRFAMMEERNIRATMGNDSIDIALHSLNIYR
jgi:hypothetical protein